MEVIFIDPEPPDASGGGIRAYLRLALRICRDAGHAARVYTHNPQAYPGETAHPIGRKPWLLPPFRGLAYRLCYPENVLWEHARWLEAELKSGDAPDRIYEFCDFLGYGFFALRDRTLRKRILLRVHTPAYLVPGALPDSPVARLAARLGAWRERDCLRRALRLTVPSAVFIREKLPWLSAWEHIPNPLPPDPGEAEARIRERALGPAGVSAAAAASSAAAEKREPILPAAPAAGLPPVDGSGWAAAEPDPGEAAERNAPRPVQIRPDRFLYLGRVEERKGVSVLVRAFIRLAAERPFASLTLVGGAVPGPYSASVRALIESLPPELKPRIQWEPPCSAEARPALLRRFTALVAPSLWENSPYVYFEGMAAGLACIGSATGEMKAVAEITGALSPRPGDEEDWLNALRSHCAGGASGAIAAQSAYLRDRRAKIASQLVDGWRRAAEAGSAGPR